MSKCVYHEDQSYYLTQLIQVNQIFFDQEEPSYDSWLSQSSELLFSFLRGMYAASHSAVTMLQRIANTPTSSN